MAMFPIHDLAREADIRMRRRRAVALLVGIVIVPWLVSHHDNRPHDGSHRRAHVHVSVDDDLSIRSDGIPQAELNGLIAAVPGLGRLGLSVRGAALPQPNPDAPSRTFTTASLTVDLHCADSVVLLAKPGVAGQVLVSVRPGQDEALQDLVLQDGTLTQQGSCGSEAGDFIVQTSPEEALLIRQSGSTDIRGGRFEGPVSLEVSGEGSLVLDSTGSLVDRQSSGGDVFIGAVDGILDAQISGSGDLRVNQGQIARLSVQSTGSGDVALGRATADGSSIDLLGSGGFEADRLAGPIRAHSAGSGDISIGSVTAETAQLSGDGSGDIVVRGGRIGMLRAERRGSGDLVIRAVVGRGQVTHDGQGEVTMPHVTGSLVRLGHEDDG